MKLLQNVLHHFLRHSVFIALFSINELSMTQRLQLKSIRCHLKYQ